MRHLGDPFFDSLKKDYQEFPLWFAKKALERAYVFENDFGTIDGFLYLKEEVGPLLDIQPALPSARRLKVGTLKINPHGTRMGERFIKKIFDHAIYLGSEEIYVTVFASHAALVVLFERYGFVVRGSKVTENGTELVLIRSLDCDFVGDVVKNYPLVSLARKKVYLLALHPQWHTRLLPDSILSSESANVVQDVSHSNSIHKVYLAAMRGMENLQVGDILLIYRTSDDLGPAYYRSVATSICVVEEYRNIKSFRGEQEFLAYCQPYSVFTEEELRDFWLQKKYPHVVRFTYNIALSKRVNRKALIEDVGLDEGLRWGFIPLTHRQLLNIAERGGVNESFIVY